jgi:FkbM family methyltransferase
MPQIRWRIRCPMKTLSETVLAMIHLLLQNDPELAPAVEAIAANAQNKNKNDSDLLIALYSDLLSKSRAQLRQDIFVLAELHFKRNGFFVEFGATNGVDLSNTYLLEKEFAWSGILAEPAKAWHKALSTNRSASIETKCVWRDSNSILEFNEVDQAEYSTIQSFSSSDVHTETRMKGNSYEVQTISLTDLLRKFNAPNKIDYLSIDTEGSEFDILEAFDFDEYQFSAITCEHNHTPNREKIFDLLTRHGYTRKFEQLSSWDDWYVLTN